MRALQPAQLTFHRGASTYVTASRLTLATEIRLWADDVSVLSEATRSLTMGAKVSDEASRSIKPLEGSRSWVRRTRSMEIQSIFAWKALPEAGFSKNVVIDAHRCRESSHYRDHPSPGGPAIQGHSSKLFTPLRPTHA